MIRNIDKKITVEVLKPAPFAAISISEFFFTLYDNKKRGYLNPLLKT